MDYHLLGQWRNAALLSILVASVALGRGTEVPGEALWAQQGGMLCGGLGAAFERLPGPRRYGPARSGLRAEVTGRPQASATFGTGCSAALDAAPPVVGAVAAHAGAPKSGSAAARAPLSVGGDFGAQIDAEILRMGAGRIVVPAGLFSFSTTISIPRGISLQGGGGYEAVATGGGAGGTVLRYTGDGCAVVVGDSSGSSELWTTGVIQDLVLLGSGGGAGICFGGDPNGVWGPPGLEAFGYHFSNLDVSGFERGVDWGNNAFNSLWVGVHFDSNGVGVYAEPGLINSNSNNWFSGVIWNGNRRGAVVQPDGGYPGGIAFSCSQCDFEWNDSLSEWSTDGAGAAPQITGGGVCFDCHFEGWGGPFWVTTRTMVNPEVQIVGGFAGADSAKMTSDPVEFRFRGTGAGPHVQIVGMSFNTAHAVGNAVECYPDGTNPICEVSDLNLPGGDFSNLVNTAPDGGSGLWQGATVNLPVAGTASTSADLKIGVEGGTEGLDVLPSDQPPGVAAPSPAIDQSFWTGSGFGYYRQFVDPNGVWNIFRNGGGGAYNFNGTVYAGSLTSTTPDAARSGFINLAAGDRLAWRASSGSSDVTLGPPAASGDAAVTDGNQTFTGNQAFTGAVDMASSSLQSEPPTYLVGGVRVARPTVPGMVAETSQLPLQATSARVGGALIAPGWCFRFVVEIPGAKPGMVALASPSRDLGPRFNWSAGVYANGEATVRVCNRSGSAAVASSARFGVRVVQ